MIRYRAYYIRVARQKKWPIPVVARTGRNPKPVVEVEAMSVLSAPGPRVCMPASKPVRRTIQVVSPGRIAITFGKVTTTYAIAEFPVGDPYDGQAFRLTKDFGDVYDVFLHRFGQNDSCD